MPRGSEAQQARDRRDRRPGLGADPSLVQVVPLTRTLRDHESEVTIEPDDTNGLSEISAAQCQHIRAVATSRVSDTLGNVGTAVLTQVRETLAVLLDL